MIASVCMGGTGCTYYSCTCHSNTDVTRSITIVYDPRAHSYASNLPDLPLLFPDTKEELKAKMREYCRELTLAAQEDLAWLHDQEKVLDGHPRVRYHHRPGRRRTCTAVRNFRGRP